MIGYVLFSLSMLVGIVAVFTNHDLFSPAKFYLLYLVVFFADIFRSPYLNEIYVTYLLLLGIAGVAVILEAEFAGTSGLSRLATFRVPDQPSRRVVVVLWILSCLPLLAQWYMIQRAGGLTPYINSLGMRVLEWRGLGPVRTVLAQLPILNAFYLAVLLRSEDQRIRRWGIFAIHLTLVVFLGLLSGSRGGLLYSVLLLVVIYNYLSRPVRPRFAIPLGIALLATAIVLGQARNRFRISERGLRTGLEGGVESDQQTFRYGLIPLELVYARDPRQLQWGLTYATAITNFVPRKIWPEKPSSGGVVLTRDYTGDRWRGASHLAPGVIGEGILNFGTIGIAVGGGVMFLGLVLALLLYSSMLGRLEHEDSPDSLVMPIAYGIVASSVATLLFGEFTNVVVQLLTKLVPLFMLYALYLRIAGEGPTQVQSAPHQAHRTSEPLTAS
jgi:oligosaccharide repeat unit polymerase